MYQLHSLALSITPVDSAASNVTQYLVGYGPVGIFLVVLAFLLYRGWGLYSPARLRAEKEACRADLIAENARLIAEKTKAEQQRDDALRAAGDQLVPALLSFTSATNALLPLLQKMVTLTEAQERKP